MIKNRKLAITHNQQNWEKIINLLSKCTQDAESVFMKELDVLNREYVGLMKGEDNAVA